MADELRQHREGLAQIEVRSIDYIPPAERHGRIRDQFTLWFGLNANIFPVVLGGVVVFMGLDFGWACIAIVLGVVIGLVLVGFHAIQGPRLGVPQMIQSRGQFGFYGAVLVFAASIVLDFGFLAAQLVIQAVAGSWALPVMAVSLIGSDVANAYTGMLALASIVSCVKDVQRSVAMRVIGSLLVIAAGTGCALLGYQQFVNNLANFLNVLLYVFIPWSAINLTDYYLVKRGDYDVASFFSPHGRYGGYLWRGLIAYVLAVAAEVPFIDQAFYVGPLVSTLRGIDISWVVGGLAGFMFYLIALRVPARRLTRPASAPAHP